MANSRGETPLVPPQGDTGDTRTELGELKENLKISFTRMREDIHYNRQQVEDLIAINKSLQEQIISLQNQLKAFEKRPAGLKSGLLRGMSRNRKSIIKQRILSILSDSQYKIPELKEKIVDEKNYCSKASFYRYIEELKNKGLISFIEIQGETLVAVSKPYAGIQPQNYI